MDLVSKFPIEFNEAQLAILNEWLQICRWVWNEGRFLLMEHDENTEFIKETYTDEKGKEKTRKALAVQTGERPHRQFKNIIKTETGEEEEVWAPHSWIIAKGKNGGTVNLYSGEATHNVEPGLIRVGQCCPVPLPYIMPRLGLEPIGKYTLQYYFTQVAVEFTYGKQWGNKFSQIPAWFVRGVCKALSIAWGGYKSRRLGLPKFKRASDLTESFTHEDGKSFKVEGNEIRIPKLGVVQVQGLEAWGDRKIKVVRLVRKPDLSWELQLTRWQVRLGDCDVKQFAAVEDSLTPAELHTISQALRFVTIREALGVALAGVFPVQTQVYLRFHLPLWTFKRKAKTRLTIDGTGFKLATDDRGKTYTCLPVRHSDGAIDPHGVIAAINQQILKLEREIAWKVESHKKQREAGSRPGQRRLQALRRKLKLLRRRKTSILRNCRKKVAHFASERSQILEIIKPATPDGGKRRKPKAKLKPGTCDPAVFDANGATVVAEHNKSRDETAPAEFVALLQNEAAERGQRVVIPLTPAKQPTKKTKKTKNLQKIS